MRIDSLYPTLVAVRAGLCGIWVALYILCRDPFFLVLFGIVGFGMAWTWAAYVIDRRLGTRAGAALTR